MTNNKKPGGLSLPASPGASTLAMSKMKGLGSANAALRKNMARTVRGRTWRWRGEEGRVPTGVNRMVENRGLERNNTQHQDLHVLEKHLTLVVHFLCICT